MKLVFDKLQKTREIFWSGRRDLNSGPPAPKSGVLSLGSPSFSIAFLKTKGLSQNLVVAPCTEMWLRMHRVPPISPSAKKQRNTFSDSVSLVWCGAVTKMSLRQGLVALRFNPREPFGSAAVWKTAVSAPSIAPKQEGSDSDR